MAYLSRSQMVAELQAAIGAWIDGKAEADDPAWDCYLPPRIAERMAEAATAVMWTVQEAEQENMKENRFA